MGQPDPLLRPADVAEMFGVESKTVAKWAKLGKLDFTRTIGGHRRYRLSEVLRAKRQRENESVAR